MRSSLVVTPRCCETRRETAAVGLAALGAHAAVILASAPFAAGATHAAAVPIPAAVPVAASATVTASVATTGSTPAPLGAARNTHSLAPAELSGDRFEGGRRHGEVFGRHRCGDALAARCGEAFEALERGLARLREAPSGLPCGGVVARDPAAICEGPQASPIAAKRSAAASARAAGHAWLSVSLGVRRSVFGRCCRGSSLQGAQCAQVAAGGSGFGEAFSLV